MAVHIISLGLIFFSSVVCNGQYTMNLNIIPSTSKENDRVTIECNVTNSQSSPFTVVLIKRIPGENVEMDIADRQGLKSPFNNARYTSVYKEVQTNTIVRLTLTITSVKASDSGEIGCKVPNNNVEIFRHFTMFVPVKSVRLSSSDLDGTHAVHNIDGTAQMAEFREGELRKVACHVTGSYPKPEVRMLIGDRDITKELFNETATLIKEGPTGNQALSYKVEVWNRALSVDYSFNNQPLRCVASLPKSGFENKTASITVTLLGFRPKFTCSNTKTVDLYTANVNLSCRVHANPAITSVRFHWKRHSTGNVSLEAGKQDGYYTGTLRPGNDDNKEMVLNIHRVFVEHFRTYYFVAENQHGETEYAITLQQDHAQALKNGAVANQLVLHLGIAALTLISDVIVRV